MWLRELQILNKPKSSQISRTFHQCKWPFSCECLPTLCTLLTQHEHGAAMHLRSCAKEPRLQSTPPAKCGPGPTTQAQSHWLVLSSTSYVRKIFDFGTKWVKSEPLANVSVLPAVNSWVDPAWSGTSWAFLPRLTLQQWCLQKYETKINQGKPR